MFRLHIFLSLLISFSICSKGFSSENHSHSVIKFVENRNQLPQQVKFQTSLPYGNLYFEKNRLTYNFIEAEYFDFETHEKANTQKEVKFKAHAFQVNFVNSNPETIIVPNRKRPEVHNYLTGNDQTKWDTNLGVYEEIFYKSLYSGIDLSYYSNKNTLKYDFIVQPNANPDLIKMKYNGVEKIAIDNGRLYITTSVNEIIEEQPYAYQIIDGIQQQVPCHFTLENNIVGFKTNGSYNKSIPLIIDPALIFVTYTGTTTGLSANCNTVDNSGNLYISGQALGNHFPTTPGAYQISGRPSSVVISKFNATGSGLIYSTFLGNHPGASSGLENAYPLALAVTPQKEIIVLGSTESGDFPTTANAYDRSLGGEMDYFISKLSANGDALIASTYIGGSSFESGGKGAGLFDYPAGLVLDNNANIFICGTSNSSDFPIIGGFQSVKKNSNDGIIAKFDNNLSNLLWSSFIGTTQKDIISDIKIGASGKIYVAGYTMNFSTLASGLQTTNNVIKPNPIGKDDGFIAVISPNGNQVLACTYIGTNKEDNLRFIDLDAAENIYIIGYTRSSYPVTTNTYTYPATNKSGGYYIHKINNSLTNTIFSTHIGSEQNFYSLTPTAFNVDDCENIYFSGYSFEANYPITSNAFQPNLRSIYTCQLSPQADSLIFGSFFGASDGWNHVHFANRSTITEDGHLYHIECTTSSTYPVTNGAHSSMQTGGRNDGAIVKFKFDPPPTSAVKANIQNPVLPGCAPYTLTFSNLSIGSRSYKWNFGDGSPVSTEVNPTHVFQNPGIYQVKLVATGQKSCLDPTTKTDSTIIQVEVKSSPELPKSSDIICQGSLELDAGNPGSTYKWFNGATSRTIIVNQPGSYQVEIDNGVCKTTKVIEVKAGIDLDVPNIITPNNDNKNDFLVISNGGPGTSLKIFNRWGSLVYNNDNYENNWGGDNLSEGVYYYLINSSVTCGKAQKGWIQIVK